MNDLVYLPILITAEGVTFRTFEADDIIDVVLTRRGYGLDEGCMSVSLFQFVLHDRSTIDVVPGCLWFLYNDLRYQKEYKSIVDIVELFNSDLELL